MIPIPKPAMTPATSCADPMYRLPLCRIVAEHQNNGDGDELHGYHLVESF